MLVKLFVVLMMANGFTGQVASADEKPGSLWEQVRDVEKRVKVCRAELVQIENRFSVALTDASVCQAEKYKVERKLNGIEVALSVLAEKAEYLEGQNKTLCAENAKLQKELARLKPKK